jgi:hypothetical protein
MDETRSQLSDKLESLEHQVSDTVKSTGTAVNATVSAVQNTVETVTGAVRDAALSVSNAFDVRRQVDRHPWLVLGGSVALGYLAFRFLAGSVKKSHQPSETSSLPHPSADIAAERNGQPAVESAATAAPAAAASESGLKSSSWHQLRSLASGALIGIAHEVVAHAVPEVMDYVTGNRSSTPINGSNDAKGRR